MENNPNKATESNLDVENKFKRSIWWKIYFFVITILTAIGMVSFLQDPQSGISEYIMLALSVATTIGFFGFVFLKKIYKPMLWLPILVTSMTFSIIYYFITDLDLRMGMSDTIYYISNVFSWMLFLPAYYGLYAYSKPDDPAWNCA